MTTLFWHDYETFGSNARVDRPCQFAGVRTDLDLNLIDEPVKLFCKPAPDFLPDPGACRVTGITPQHALREGVIEAEFCARILREFMEPGTCGAGYNSLRFDDEISRHMFYRCFHDPYEREWKSGNARWDLIDLVRMAHALRPAGIQWPLNDEGKPSFRLEALTAANNIEHSGAHDAMVDVYATIAMARLVKTAQPKLYDFYWDLRSKHKVLGLLDLARHTPVVHVSGMFPAERGCLGVVMPLIKDPQNNNGIVVLDLLQDPSAWLELSADEIRQRLYTRTEDLPEGETRIALKTIHINRAPAVAPVSVLTETVLSRYPLDMELVEQRRQQLLAMPELLTKLREVFQQQDRPAPTDPDFMLYTGGFFSDQDKRTMQKLHQLPPAKLAGLGSQFQDPRLPELLFRFRARNYPETLDAQEQQQWQQFCQQRLAGQLPGAGVSLPAFQELLQQMPDLDAALRTELEAYATTLGKQFGVAC